jgi:superfamily II DNA or RNA helicase
VSIVEYKIKKPGAKQDDTIILSSRLFVPEHLVTDEIKKAFTYQIGERCADCVCDDPTVCQIAQIYPLELFQEFNDGDTFGFARGNIKKLKALFDWSKVEDQRSRRKMKNPITFIGKLYPAQKKVVHEWMAKKYGIYKSPPRSGKTVICSYITCTMGYQTLILVHQDELAQQFYNTFMNLNTDEKGNPVIFTNAPDLEKETGKTVVGIAKSLDDLNKDWSVTIMTYQKFIRQIPKLKKMRDKWGMVFVDEAHLSSAPVWSKILNILNPKIKFGCSATPKRKDNLHCIADNVLGPVTAEGTATQLRVGIEYIQTEHKIESFKRWTTFINRMTKDEDRNQLIADRIAGDAESGHAVLATTTRVAHAKRIGKLLDMQGYKVAVITGGTFDRKKIFSAFKEGELQIIVASRQITQVGLDLPILSAMHIMVPNMNQFNLEQEASRCLTPYPGKKEPVVRVYIDTDHKVALAVKRAFSRVLEKLNSYIIKDDVKVTYKGWG